MWVCHNVVGEELMHNQFTLTLSLLISNFQDLNVLGGRVSSTAIVSSVYGKEIFSLFFRQVAIRGDSLMCVMGSVLQPVHIKPVVHNTILNTFKGSILTSSA